MFGGSSATLNGQDAVYTFERPKTTRKTFIKGSMFAPVPAFTRQYLGADGWEAFLERLDPLSAQVMKSEFVALAWYPFSVIADVARCVELTGKAFGKTNPLSDLAHASLETTTRGIFRAIFKIGSPEFMISRADQVWRKFFSNGEMSTKITSRGHATVQLRGMPDMTTPYSVSVLHTLEGVISKSGGRITVAEMTQDLGRGDDCSEYTYRWT
ncbi:MAG TPA: hypothetical protein VH062_13225 [Polyangiaceae bacterium]|jgi:hypothetical protein|nr:hypothetical protein [Polyangiaceae bacterium]